MIEIDLVKVFRVVDIQRSKQRENIGLNSADQKFQRTHKGDEYYAEQGNEQARPAGIDRLDNEVREHLDQNMSSNHRNEQPQCEAEWTHQE